MMKLTAVSLIFVAGVAHAESWQAINAQDEFCMGEVRMVLSLQAAAQKGQQPDLKLLEKWIGSDTGAIAEKMMADLAKDPNVDPKTFFKRGYAMCMDNVRRVILNAKEGRRTRIDELR
jgi:hypothetical protein